MALQTPFGQAKVFAQVFRNKKGSDITFNYVYNNLRALTLYSRMKGKPSIEIGTQATQYKYLSAMYLNLKQKRRKQLMKNRAKLMSLGPAQRFHGYRREKLETRQFLDRLCFLIDANGQPLLKGSMPDVELLQQIIGQPEEGTSLTLMSMRAWSNIVMMNDLWAKGIPINLLDSQTIHPMYGVWTPFQHEYLNLLQKYLRSERLSGYATDVGCGTGVLGLILAKLGLSVTCTDVDPIAISCTKYNAGRLELPVKLLQQNLHTCDALPGSDVIICNPPWLPVAPTQDSEKGSCDKGGKLLSRFLGLARSALGENGRIILFHSSYPALLQLQPADHIETLAKEHGLVIRNRLEISFPIELDTRHPLKEFRDAAKFFLYDLRKSHS